ncbi:MAG: cell division protein ZipA C-terminal FtsZ-binding domain-containing protein [Kangiellaceae bacterium]|jgi:cell division protein ZipA|nr:cell division protein ZipA C-terminal FtsZ-binding domain-containing protein [Kangiellaceae bacterium]
MEWQLRLILIIVGALIIAGVIYDGYRRKKKSKRSLNDSPFINNESTATDGYDLDGVGQVRVRKLDDSLTAEGSISDVAETIITGDRLADSNFNESTDNLEEVSSSGSTDDHKAQQIFSLTLLSNDDSEFNGESLLGAMIELGCRYGDMKIFHRLQSVNDVSKKLYSIANAFNPGYFDIDTMPSQNFKAITFFCQFPNSIDAEICYRQMVDDCKTMQMAIGGRIMDSNRSVFTQQTYHHELEVIKELKRKSLTRN